MDKTTYQNKTQNYKKGTYIAMVWKTTIGNYEKISSGVVRLVNVDIQVSKQNIEYVRIRTTNNPKQKVKVKYFNNGVEITQQEYEKANPTKSQVNGYFSKHLVDILALGK